MAIQFRARYLAGEGIPFEMISYSIKIVLFREDMLSVMIIS